MGQPIVEFRQVTKIYEGTRDDLHTVVNMVDFTVQQGEIIALMGHNGAGKTSLLKMLLGLTTPTAGKILVNGQEVRSNGRVKELIGYVPEKVAFPANLSAIEVLHFYGGLRGVSPSRCTKVLEQVGLTQSANQRVGAFSKGMTQRLGVAQAILAKPQLLILDEPTSGLDPAGESQFKRLIEELHSDGLTILFTSHFLNEIEELADRVAVMKKGELCVVDSLEGLKMRSGLLPRLEINIAEPVPNLLTAAQVAGAATACLESNRLSVTCLSEQKAAILEAVQKVGCRILDIRSIEPSLEDVLINLSALEDLVCPI